MHEIEVSPWRADGELVLDEDNDAVCECYWSARYDNDEERVERAKERAKRIARLPALEADNVRLRTLLRELVEYWDAVTSDDAMPEAVMMMEDAVRRAREEVDG